MTYIRRFLIMATDGLWDCISNQDAVDFVKDKITDPLISAKSLVQLVYRQGTDRLSRICISVLVAFVVSLAYKSL